jgi:hypothetical protein
MGPQKNVFCSVLLRLNKTPRKHHPSHLLLPWEAFKEKFVWCVFLSMIKTGFKFSTALAGNPLYCTLDEKYVLAVFRESFHKENHTENHDLTPVAVDVMAFLTNSPRVKITSKAVPQQDAWVALRCRWDAVEHLPLRPRSDTPYE